MYNRITLINCDDVKVQMSKCELTLESCQKNRQDPYYVFQCAESKDTYSLEKKK